MALLYLAEMSKIESQAAIILKVSCKAIISVALWGLDVLALLLTSVTGSNI